ncbi:CDP-glycerol glycerophosphotransferase family protein [Spiribacter sp. SSL99]|uniref:CDP-glycerol glycerophosphotransferase family protein n=1 Tax=Spiribacter sp. SSL99 TaxID=1866884 RepID=UPI00132FE6A6|nr:CDP-glycerol glycerophosphotransferase family protein [Spiribacter sp. SSL99]
MDTVFRAMMKDARFDPQVLVCPYKNDSPDAALERMEVVKAYFLEQGYPVTSAYDVSRLAWVHLDELRPDIVFFTNANKVTRDEYYEQAFLHYLSCYVPYYFLATDHAGDDAAYNMTFHNSMWRIFMPHRDAVEKARVVADNDASNCVLTGYPASEPLLESSVGSRSAWKDQTSPKKRVIFAPHHTISRKGRRLSNFLTYADFMVELSQRHAEEVQWSFKPHPMLKEKLYQEESWGKARTDRYFRFWEESVHTQLDEGGYVELFQQSDAMIHDCSSFLVEYLLVSKPCLYLLGDQAQEDLINAFGQKALGAHRKAVSPADIENFVLSLKEEGVGVTDMHRRFLEDEIWPLHEEQLPSERILSLLARELA